MLNEGRGISDVNIVETEKLFNLFKEVGYKNEIPYKVINTKVLITFELGEYYAYVELNNHKFNLHFVIPKDYDDIKFKTIITHELNHLIEVYNVIEKK